MIRKLLVLLETAIVLAVLLLGFAFWQQKEALNQPLKVAQEQLLDVPAAPRQPAFSTACKPMV